MDGSRIRKEKVEFSNENGYVRIVPQCLSVHPCTLIKLCCLIPFSIYQSISLAALEVKCA